MALIKQYTNDTAGKQQALIDRTTANFTGLFRSIRASYESSMKNMWKDDSATGGLSIQEKFDGFGVESINLFKIADATATFLVALDPTYVPMTPASLGHTYTLNQDGSVTVNS